MEKTTTKKTKRNIELESIKNIIENNKLKIKEAAGKNIDALKKLLTSDKSEETDNQVNEKQSDENNESTRNESDSKD